MSEGATPVGGDSQPVRCHFCGDRFFRNENHQCVFDTVEKGKKLDIKVNSWRVRFSISREVDNE